MAASDKHADKHADKPLQAVVPYLTIAGATDAIEYYKKAFGAEVVRGPMLADDGKRVMHAQLSVSCSKKLELN